MKAILKVNELREIKDKGYLLVFQTQYGEELSTFYNSEIDIEKLKTLYPIGLVDLFDVVPYSSKGSLGLSVYAPLKEISSVELF